VIYERNYTRQLTKAAETMLCKHHGNEYIYKTMFSVDKPTDKLILQLLYLCSLCGAFKVLQVSPINACEHFAMEVSSSTVSHGQITANSTNHDKKPILHTIHIVLVYLVLRKSYSIVSSCNY